MKSHKVLGWLMLVSIASFGGQACSSTMTVQALDDDAGVGTKPADGGGTTTKDGSTIVKQDSGIVPVLDASDDTGRTTPVPNDSGTINTDGGTVGFDGGSMCPGTAPTVADLDAAGGWNPPPPLNRTACSLANITTFQNNFSTALTWNDLVKNLPTTCAQCLLSKESDTQWKLIVTDATGQAGFLNYGACYARAPYGSDACGKAVQYDEFCLSVSCSSCPDAQYSSCLSASSTVSACTANFSAAIQTGCGTDAAKLQALDASCGSAASAAKVLCANTLPDGGHP
jgi:hypothetical protein